MPMDVTFFEKYLAIYQTDFVSDHSHAMGLWRKFVNGLFFFVDLRQLLPAALCEARARGIALAVKMLLGIR